MKRLVFLLVINITFILMPFGQLLADFAGGDGTEANPYQITTHGHLNNVRNHLNDEDVHFILMNDIDLTEECAEGGAYWNDGEGWEPIGDWDQCFKGYFNGNNNIINGLFIETYSDYQGLFGYINDSAIIAKLGVTNVNLSGGYFFVGGLVGYSSGTIQNSYSTGSVSGSGYVGGLIGLTIGGTIQNSYSTGSVSGSGFVGGLIGLSTGTITNSYSTGEVSGYDYVGGLVGYREGSTIENSYWNTETSGQATGDGGEGRTTEEMTYPYATNTYVDWDFTETWSADTDYTMNNGYPYLSEATVDTEDEALVPISNLNLSNYPNPFNPRTTITFSLSHPGKTTIEIYNVKGQKLLTLLSEQMSIGDHQIVWNGTDSRGQLVSSGVYFTRLITNEKQKIVKMLLMK